MSVIHQILQRGRAGQIHSLLVRFNERCNFFGLMDGDTTPCKGCKIHLHRFPVQCDGLFDGRGRERYLAELEGIAKHEHISGNRIAQ